jgi:hypothetical protein
VLAGPGPVPVPCRPIRDPCPRPLRNTDHLFTSHVFLRYISTVEGKICIAENLLPALTATDYQ